MKKQLIWTLLKYGLGFALLAWVVWANWEPANGSPGLKQTLQREIHVWPLVMAFVVCTGSLLVTFVRWYLLVRTQELPFSMRDAFRLGMVGFAMSTLLPGSIGGDIIKATFLAREQSRRTVAVATVVFDRILGLMGLFWLAAFLGAVFWCLGGVTRVELVILLLGAWAVVGGSLLFWFVLGLISEARAEAWVERLTKVPKVGGSLAEVWRTLALYRQRGKNVWQAMLLAVVGHVGFVLVFYLAALTLSPASALPSLGAHYLIVPVGKVVEAGFPTPNGIGGGELAYSTMYEWLGFAAAAGLFASLVQRVVFWSLGLVGYVLYLWLKPQISGQPPRTIPQTVPDTSTMREPCLKG